MTLEIASKVCRECLMTSDVLLREVTEGDLPIFFEQQRDPAANRMAAFTAKDPADRAAFTAKWAKILGDDSSTNRTILSGGQVAGSIGAFVAPWSGKLEVTYWIGREFWGNRPERCSASNCASTASASPSSPIAAMESSRGRCPRRPMTM